MCAEKAFEIHHIVEQVEGVPTMKTARRQCLGDMSPPKREDCPDLDEILSRVRPSPAITEQSLPTPPPICPTIEVHAEILQF